MYRYGNRHPDSRGPSRMETTANASQHSGRETMRLEKQNEHAGTDCIQKQGPYQEPISRLRGPAQGMGHRIETREGENKLKLVKKTVADGAITVLYRTRSVEKKMIMVMNQ